MTDDNDFLQLKKEYRSGFRGARFRVIETYYLEEKLQTFQDGSWKDITLTAAKNLDRDDLTSKWWLEENASEF